MDELIQKLVEHRIKFIFTGKEIITDEVDTGYYGVVSTTIKFNYYNDGNYSIHHGYKGYPQYDSYRSIEEVLEYILERAENY